MPAPILGVMEVHEINGIRWTYPVAAFAVAACVAAVIAGQPASAATGQAARIPAARIPAARTPAARTPAVRTPAAGIPAAGIPAGRAGAGMPGVSAHDLAIMRAQIPLDRAAEQVLAAASSLPPSHADGLGGTWVSGAARTLTVYWKGPVPRAISILLARLSSATVRVKVEPARYTRAELDERAARVSHVPGVWAAATRPDAGGLIVWPDRGANITSGALYAAADNIPLQVVRAAKPAPAQVGGERAMLSLPTSGRLADSSPHWAGARVEGQQQSGVSTIISECTSGFPMARDSDGRTFITTANHCFGWLLNISGRTVESWWSPGYGSSTDPNANNTYKFGDTWYSYPDLDTKIIRSTVQGDTYDHGVRPGTETHKPVVSASSNAGGDSVCESGAGAGIICGVTIVPATRTVNGVTVHGWLGTSSLQVKDINGNLQDMGGCDGDSGGPVFTLDADPSRVSARGLVSQGGGTQYDWVNNNNETLSCGSQVFYVDIQEVLNRLGAHIVTGA